MWAYCGHDSFEKNNLMQSQSVHEQSVVVVKQLDATQSVHVLLYNNNNASQSVELKDQTTHSK